MKNLGSKVAAGAAWMVGLRLLQRSLGLISTAVLARLLVPADFGLIAMALSVAALVELITILGFDLALIRKQNATREHFDTAWTLGLVFRTVAAFVIVIGAPHVAAFYSEPRLTEVMYVYAAIAFISGLENIGIVAFRKELEFNREFRFQLAKKLLAVGGTVALALYFRSYWALALGTLLSQVIGVGLSYVMHPYRPKLRVSAWREMLGFSSWLVFNNFTVYLRDRGADFVLGRFLGPQPLGAYRVSNEIASLPTTELYGPIMKAVFPGFSKLVDDRPALQRAYVASQGAVIAVTLPAAVGVILLAEQIVQILLGPGWDAAVPLIQILGLYGATKIFHGNRHSLFMALGRPYWVGIMTVLELAIMYPLMIYWLMNGHGIEMAAWARVLGSALTLPAGVGLVTRALGLGRFELMKVMWRPLLSTAAMSFAVLSVQHALPESGSALAAFGVMVVSALVGAFVYVFVTLVAWLIVGRPQGIEQRFLNHPKLKRHVPSNWLSERP
ncbi:lipopolysaccharide biosynthesis protein [Thauera butanivorans]|uniref:lipopolysaccharide biosynthesis protein n=1 Tax=Thauera butanivorans TaxID=86174 RepID=UPI000839209A|nr:lipopolysaccharide biosynthesis protein [Thauera butanivorans]